MFTNRTNKNLYERKSASVALLVMLVLALILPATTPLADTSSRAQPLLLQMAQDNPDALVSVIVQKNIRDASLETWVAEIGGKVTQNLGIINAFVVEIPGRAVPELARMNGVSGYRSTPQYDPQPSATRPFATSSALRLMATTMGHRTGLAIGPKAVMMASPLPGL